MQTNITDADALDRIGRDVVMDHFGLTRQNLYHWRSRGIPSGYRKAVKLLGESQGKSMDDFDAEKAA